jgi:CheY-like chemotaxis protein
MDLRMPVMGGIEATEKIRKIEATQNIPIIAMTANAMLSDQQKCMNVGMNHYLSKPISLEQIETILSQCLEDQSNVNLMNAKVSDESIKKQHLKRWDQESLLKRVLNREDILKKLLKLCLAEIPCQIDSLKLAIEEQKYPEVISIAHAIRGIAANISAEKLENTAEQLELLDYSVNADYSYQLYSELMAEYQLLATLIKHQDQTKITKEK